MAGALQQGPATERGAGLPTSRPRTRLLRCVTHGSPVTDELAQAVHAQGHRNVFNPSAVVWAGRWNVTYRQYGADGRLSSRAVWLRQGAPGLPWTWSDLTERTRLHGVDKVADPKLVCLGTELFVTFNSGYSREGNELYLMRLAPEPGPPQLCITTPRQLMEKNWGFFLGPDGLQVLYRVSPLQLLRLSRGSVGVGDLHFESGTTGTAPVRQLSLGTQPVVRGDDLLLVAHQRVYLRGRRGYLGRPLAVHGALSPGGRVEVEPSPVRLVHSLTSFLRRGVSSNPHLLFASYFSGLHLDGDSAVLGYGVNDNSFGFATATVGALWR